jgi:hypothetical protein
MDRTHKNDLPISGLLTFMVIGYSSGKIICENFLYPLYTQVHFPSQLLFDKALKSGIEKQSIYKIITPINGLFLC